MRDDAVKGERFIEQNADKLVHNLAHHCSAGAKEVVDALGEQVPATLKQMLYSCSSLRYVAQSKYLA